MRPAKWLNVGTNGYNAFIQLCIMGLTAVTAQVTRFRLLIIAYNCLQQIVSLTYMYTMGVDD